VTGRRPDGSPYTSSQFSFSGGMGARATKPGPDATCYPTGIGATPIEVLEMETPIVFHRRELRPGSGGAGRTRGGDGQVIEFGMRTGLPWHLNAAPTGLRQPPAGLDGGACGATGRFMRNGVDWQTVGKVRMDAGDMVRMETPGAGGFGPPAPAMHDNRDPTGERRMAAPIKVQNWKDLPSTLLLNGRMERVGFRSDEALLTFNRIEPGMKRWRPHAHPFDQIVITAAGTQILEIENETLECPAGSIVRVPANARHTGWPGGDEQVLNIDVFAPPRPDYLFLVEHQSEFPQPAQGHASYHQDPQAEAFSGAAMRDTSDVLFLWDDLPKQSLFDGKMQRSAFRSDHALVTFNWIEPGIERPEPHSHPFDQVVLVLEGAMVLEVDGREYECGPGAITRIPPDAMHTGWVVGTERVLNMDVFAPARADYLHLTTYQKDYA
jgi:quercetin dioxygenase-like cupin family protein